jgi:GNAT superfamily N-acetyltransferase
MARVSPLAVSGSPVPSAPSDLTIRPLSGPEELGLFCRLRYVLDEELADDLAADRRRTGWLWVALRGERLVARVGWWGRAGDPAPLILDVFDLDDADGESAQAGVRLLETAIRHVVPDGAPRPEYSRFLGAAWRDDPVERAAVEARMAALEQTGARLFVERLRLEWDPTAAVPADRGRLTFRPVRDRADLLGLMTAVMDGTLDAHGRADLATMPAADAAAKHYDDELARYSSPREWWRVATLPQGEPVGFVVPARNDYNAIIAYLGVLPAHRGHGYIDDILAEGTRILAAQGVPRIRASTDVGNVPMANAFARAGYVVHQRQIDLRWT